MDLNISVDMSASLGVCIIDASRSMAEDILSIFYIFSPLSHTKADPNDVPNYEVILSPAIGLLVIFEQIIRLIKRQDTSRFQDLIINIGSSLIYTLTRTLMLGVVVLVYSWVHTNFGLIDLPLYSIWTWLFSLLLVEFTYYWTHRALHEINILWAAHQFHHMAEDINITTTIRDSVVDLVLYDIFPVPLAMIVPPQILIVHMQFSLIYQIWLHNDVIGNLGPIEYIINTPTQHRVHHGKNPYCIDKNYGALLMIWDRIFGTYQTEKEKIVFGVISPTPKTYDPIVIQFEFFRDVVTKFKSVKGIKNKISAIFKGPGWSPGKPRLGLIDEVPEPDLTAPKYSYNTPILLWRKFYVLVHFTIIMIAFLELAEHPVIRYSPFRVLLAIFYIMIYLTSVAAIFEMREIGPYIEIIRCLIYLLFDFFYLDSINWDININEEFILNSTLWMIRITYFSSIFFWLYYVAFVTTSQTSIRDDLFDKNLEFEDSRINLTEKTFIKCIFVLGGILSFLAFTFNYMFNIESCKIIITD